MNITDELTAQVALGTGAGSGMGVDTARAFASAGAAVKLACREERRCTRRWTRSPLQAARR